MKSTLLGRSTALLLGTMLAACGGGGGGQPDAAPAPTTPAPTVQQTLATAAAVASNDSATNSSAPFTVLQAAGVPAVTVSSPPKVNFTVFSDGAVKTGLTISNLSFLIAKLVPGTNGDPDQWVNYVYRTETATAGVGPNGTPALASAQQATSDPKSAGQLAYNEAGYYTYTFSTDIKDPTQTRGVVFEPARTHRIGIQLSYTNAAGETVRVNPYFDFTVDANGQSVAVTDPARTRKMTDVSSCNSCHEKLALHGGGRVDTQFCVMCHNPGTTDANSGNVLTLATMAHKIHAGKLLKEALTAGKGGEDFTIWGFQDSKHYYADVGFPQDLRNCSKCHSGSNPATPQGDNWKTRPSKSACLTCHANKAGSDWDASHTVFARSTAVWAGATPTSAAKDMPNSACAACHQVGSNIAPERVHWNQSEENAARYKMNIESTTFNDTANHRGRSVTVKYFLSDPTNGNAAYNLVTSECTGTSTITCSNTTRFGNLRFYLAYQNLVGQSTSVTEFSAYNNGGSGANAFAYKGTNDGSNHYTLAIPVPDDTATAVAAGTARVVSIGQVKEPLLEVKWATDPRPQVQPEVPANRVNVVVQNAFQELALSGTLTPRRTIVATEKCNACHGALGTTSGSNTLANAFHGGARNRVEACVTCHDANRMSSTVMTNGLALNESFQFKRMIHGIHGNSKRFFPFTHGNSVVGNFCNPANTSAEAQAACNPLLTLAADVENYAAEVAWPGVGINCNVCHVDNSYKVDRGPLGAVVSKPAGVSDPLQWLVISPKAASCTACHDSPKAIAHVTSFGQASFASRTQAQSMQVQEICADCHSSGGFKGVDLVHGQK